MRKELKLVAAAFTINLMLGVIYAFSTFVKPLERDFGWSRGQTTLAFAVAQLAMNLMVMPGGVLSDRRGPRLAATISGILAGLGLSASSLTSRLEEFYIAYGLLFGSGVGLGYITAISTINKLFKERRGLLSGLVVSGYGLSAALFAPIIALLEYHMGWRWAFTLVGITVGLVVVASAQLLGIEDQLGEAKPRLQLTSVRWREFTLLWLTFAAASSAGFTVAGHLAAMAQEAGLDPITASLTVTCFSLANASGRVVVGWISDKLGRLETLATIFSCQAANMLLAFTNLHLSPLVVFTASLAAGFFYGPIYALYPSTVADYYGSENMGTLYGLLLTACAAGSMLGPYLAGAVYDITGGYTASFLILGVLLALATATVLWLRRG